MEVTTNLEAALRELRAQNITTLWIDALCINQNDLLERALQVMRMGLIYSRAQAVVLWLGEESHDSRMAFRQLQEQEPKHAFSSTTWRQGSSALSRELGARQRNPLQSLFERPFWRRVDVTSWAKLTNVFKRFKNRDHGLIVPPEVLPLLLDTLFMSRDFLATDRRDKVYVYALLGLTSDGTELIPTPNYLESTTTESVVFQALKESLSSVKLYSYLVKIKSYVEILGTTPGSTVPQPTTPVIPEWANLVVLNKGTFDDFWPHWADNSNYAYGPAIPPGDESDDLPHRLSYSGLHASAYMIDTIKTLTTSFDLLTTLPRSPTSDRNTKKPQSDEERFGNWVFENQDFPYMGRTLRGWIDSYAESKQYKGKCGEHGLLKKITKKTSLPPVEEDVAVLLAAFKRTSQKGWALQLATGLESPSGNGTAIYALPRDVQLGDLICLLYGRNIPIVVRPDGHRYRFICGTRLQIDGYTRDYQMSAFPWRDVIIC
ncbi:hypothetical protein B7463_g11261, partial [Scytalidium lignicola]